MAEFDIPRKKGSTIVDDDGKIWTLRGKKRNRDVAPKGYEFYQKPDSSVGMRRSAVGQRGTEKDRYIETLKKPEDKQKARRIALGLEGRAGAIKASGAGGGAQVPLSLDPTDPKAQVVKVTVEKPSDVKTIREMGEKVAGVPAKRAEKLVGQAKEIAGWYEMLNEVTKTINEKGNEIVTPKYGVKGNVFIQKQIDLAIQKYQRDADTDGILTAGGPGLPGTQSNPYKPANETEMNYLEPLDYFEDPEGNVRQWQADLVAQMTVDGVSSPAVLYADRGKYIKEHPRQRPAAPEGESEIRVQTAGAGMPEKPAKPKSEAKPPKTKTELEKQIEGITRTLNDPKKLTLDRAGVTRSRLEKRLEKLQKQLDELLK